MANVFDTFFINGIPKSKPSEKRVVTQRGGGGVADSQQLPKKESREMEIQVNIKQPAAITPAQQAPPPQQVYHQVQRYQQTPYQQAQPMYQQHPLQPERSVLYANDDDPREFLKWVTNGSNDMGCSAKHLFRL